MTLILIDCENFHHQHLEKVFEHHKVGPNVQAFGFCDFRLQGGYKHEQFAKYNITPQQVFHSKGKKNAADLALARFAMEQIFTKNISTLIIASSDSDFSDLMLFAKSRGIKVICYASNIQQNQILKLACDELIDCSEQCSKQTQTMSQSTQELIKLYKENRQKHKHLSTAFIELAAQNALIDASLPRQSICTHLNASGFILKRTKSHSRIFLPCELESDGRIKASVLEFLNNIQAQAIYEHKKIALDVFSQLAQDGKCTIVALIEALAAKNILSNANQSRKNIDYLRALGFVLKDEFCSLVQDQKEPNAQTKAQETKPSKQDLIALNAILDEFAQDIKADSRIVEFISSHQLLKYDCAKELLAALKTTAKQPLKHAAIEITLFYKKHFFSHFGSLFYFLKLLEANFKALSLNAILLYLKALGFRLEQGLLLPPTRLSKTLRKHLIIGIYANLKTKPRASRLCELAVQHKLLAPNASLFTSYQILQQIGFDLKLQNGILLAVFRHKLERSAIDIKQLLSAKTASKNLILSAKEIYSYKLAQRKAQNNAS